MATSLRVFARRELPVMQAALRAILGKTSSPSLFRGISTAGKSGKEVIFAFFGST